MSNEVMKEAYDDTNDVFDVLNKAEGDLFKIAENSLIISSFDNSISIL